MNYRKSQKMNIDISLLGFGVMRLPTTVTKKIDFDKAYEMFKYSVENGINYFDTAWFYHAGESEKFLGKSIQKLSCRDQVFITTKLPSMLVHKNQAMESFFNKQLERLQTDYPYT